MALGVMNTRDMEILREEGVGKQHISVSGCCLIDIICVHFSYVSYPQQQRNYYPDSQEQQEQGHQQGHQQGQGQAS